MTDITPTQPVSHRPSSIRWIVFALACSTSFLLYLHRYTWGFIKSDVQEEFGWSLEELGMLDSMFSASYAFGQIPCGILCDWFGPHVLLSGLIVTWSLSMGAIAFATGLTSMLVCRFLFGLTQAGCYPVLSKITRIWFPISNRTFVQGWVATFFGRGGGAMSFFLFGTVLLGTFGMPWRWALGVLTLGGILFAVLFAFLFRNTPAEHPRVNPAEKALIEEGETESVAATGTRLSWGTVLRSGNMWVFLFQQFTSAYADNVYVYWIPMFLLVQKNVEQSGAGVMAAIPLVGGAVGGMLGGALQNWLILRTGNRRWARSWIGCIGKLFATAAMFAALAFDSALAIVLLFAIVKFFADWSQPTVWGTVTDLAGKNSASVFGLVNTVGSSAGFLAGPTMGLMIMFFARDATFQESVSQQAVIDRTDEQMMTQAVYPLTHKSILGDEFVAVVKNVDGTEMGRILVNNGVVTSEFDQLELADGNVTLDAKRGKLQIADPPPSIGTIDVSYGYRDFGSGWAALFLMIGVIYLASSLSWLFIDCTKTLE